MSAINYIRSQIGILGKSSPIRTVDIIVGALVTCCVLVVILTTKSGAISKSEISERSIRVLELRKEIIKEAQERVDAWKKSRHAVENEAEFDAAMRADGLLPVTEGSGRIGIGTNASFSFADGALQYCVKDVDCHKTVLVYVYDMDGIFIESVSFEVDGEWVYETRELTERERSANKINASVKYNTAMYNAINSKVDPLSWQGLGNSVSFAAASIQVQNAESQTHTGDKKWRPATCSGRVEFTGKAKKPGWYSVLVCDPGILEKAGKFFRELF